MKKTISILVLMLVLSIPTFARQYLVCLNGVSYLLLTDGSGNLQSVTTAGGCALGPWIIELRVIPDIECTSCDAGIAAVLNDKVDLESTLSGAEMETEYDELLDTFDSMILGCTTEVEISEDDLDSDILTFLTSTRMSGNVKINSDDLQIFPNPFDERINVVSSSDDISSIEILNAKGQSMFKYYPSLPFSNFDARLNQLTAGLYFVRIWKGNLTYNQKIVKY